MAARNMGNSWPVSSCIKPVRRKGIFDGRFFSTSAPSKIDLESKPRDRAAKDIIGLHSLPRSARESVNEAAFLPPPAKLVTPQALRRRTFGAAGRLRLDR